MPIIIYPGLRKDLGPFAIAFRGLIVAVLAFGVAAVAVAQDQTVVGLGFAAACVLVVALSVYLIVETRKAKRERKDSRDAAWADRKDARSFTGPSYADQVSRAATTPEPTAPAPPGFTGQQPPQH